MKKFNTRIEYDIKPIAHIAVQCPNCKKWFRGRQITTNDISSSYDLYCATFSCPLCGKQFGKQCPEWWEPEIEEIDYPEVYKDCFVKKKILGEDGFIKESWEPNNWN